MEISTIQHHLLGLNFDPHNEGFYKFIQYSREIQKEVCEQRVELLRKYGVPISFDKVKNNFSLSSLGKYSILMTMMSDKDCRDYIEKNHGQPTLKDLFKIYLSDGGIAGQVEKRRFIDWNEAIDEIHKANGLAVFAHPSSKTDNPSEVLDLLAGVDGIEIQPRYKEKNILFKEYAAEKGLFVVYGSDYHGSAFEPVMLGRDENTLDDAILGKIKR